MQIIHVTGNTYCIDTGELYIPYYKINDQEIILLDTGRNTDREGLDEVLAANHYQVKGIICSHGHIDHAGNAAYLKAKYQCPLAMPKSEAIICQNLQHLKMFYQKFSMAEIKQYLSHLIVEVDIPFDQNVKELVIAGQVFQIIQAPGHSPGHSYMITPDQVAYIADALLSPEVIAKSKLPYSYILKMDLEAKRALKELNFNNYILAHKGVYQDISTLIDENIEYYHQRAITIYNYLQGTLSYDELIAFLIDLFNIRVPNIAKYRVVERMATTYIDYLVDLNYLELVFSEGQIKYRKN